MEDSVEGYAVRDMQEHRDLAWFLTKKKAEAACLSLGPYVDTKVIPVNLKISKREEEEI